MTLLAERERQLKLFKEVGNQLVSTALTERFCLRFGIMNPHLISSDNEVQKLISFTIDLNDLNVLLHWLLWLPFDLRTAV